MKRLLLVAAAFVAMAGSVVGVETASSAATGATMRSSTNSVVDQITHLSMRGVPDAQIASRLGLERVGGGTTVAPATSSQVSVVTPVMWRAHTGIYYLKTGWGFTTSRPDGAGSGNVGGYDGFAFSLSHSVINKGGELYICPRKVTNFKCFYATNYWDNSAVGQAWRFQDRSQLLGYPPHYSGFNYSTSSGIAVFAFTPLSGCLQAFAKYTHTWSSTSVTGVDIGAWSVGFQWSNNNNYWQRTSGAGHTASCR